MIRCGIRCFLLYAWVLVSPVWSQNPTQPQSWNFAVSGDSRNCGDVIMPAIAQRSRRDGAQFYWHLGDLRAIYSVDEDMQKIAELQKKPFTISSYEQAALDDFIQNQIIPFADTPFFLGIGNHETIPPKTREDFIAQFADWLNVDAIREQRSLDHPDRSADKPESVGDHQVRTYYHWVMNGVDFINLDNATEDQFNFAQVQWFKDVIQHDSSNPEIHIVVVGMHAALPESFSRDHSMNDWSGHEWYQGESSGKDVYMTLVNFNKSTNKPVYLLASHSHFFMDDVYNTRYWQDRHAVLPGWIVGTGGAQQHTLSADAHPNWKDHTYGFLLGTVHADNTIEFRFVELDREKDIPQQIRTRYTAQFVDWCYEKNRKPATQSHDH